MASRAEAIASVAPQVTVVSVSGSTVMPYQSAYFRATASRRCLAPHVMAYWLMSAAMARAAASFRTWGAGKLGNPCARLIASCWAASRVIARMTDSVKECVRRAVCMGPNDNLLDGLQLAGSIGSVLMRPSPLAVRPRVLQGLAVVALALALTTCAREATGPLRRATFSVTPVLPSGLSLAAFNLAVDNVRLIVVRPPADSVFDDVFTFPVNQSSLSISASVPLQQSPETFQVTLQLLSGTTPLFAGSQAVTVTAGDTPTPTPIPTGTYIGPGQNVTSLTIGPLDSVLTQGGTLQFRLTAKDAQGAIVPTFYASWTTSDTNVVKVDGTGVLTAPFTRATVSVLAHTPNNVSASTPITFAPAATAISIVSGCNQGAPPGGQLPQPVVAKVTAGDGLGVRGVAVTFTAPPGGAVVPTQAVTDANGLAQTVVTLGSTPGPTSLSISASGLTPVA